MNTVCAKFVVPVKNFIWFNTEYISCIYLYTLFWYPRSLILHQQCWEDLKSHTVKFTHEDVLGGELVIH